MEKALTYFMHDTLHVERAVSIQIIGCLQKDDLIHLIDSFPVCEPVSWTFVEKDQNVGYSESVGINHELFSRDAFLEFNVDEDCVEFDTYLNKHYPVIAQQDVTVMFCSGSYAQLHSDSNSVLSRGQLMFILSNESRHTFISIDDSGVTHELAPSAGDIVLMDIACRHALLPKNVDIKDLDSMKPLKMAMVSMNNF
jgi:hypothetical protein